MEETLIIDYHEVDIQREDQVLLYNVNLQVHEGEFVYLTGVVGSGNHKINFLRGIFVVARENKCCNAFNLTHHNIQFFRHNGACLQ